MDTLSVSDTREERQVFDGARYRAKQIRKRAADAAALCI
jgi:hypothetical protein